MAENMNQQDNDKSPYIKIKDRTIAILCLVVPWIIIIAIGINKFKEDDEKFKKKNECIEKDCHEQRMKGEIYCPYHRLQATEAIRKREEEKKNTDQKIKEAKNNIKNYTNSGIIGSGNNNSGSKDYKINDPMDYDSPEDYADDAWGVDFEDWDDAYDYWEDVME